MSAPDLMATPGQPASTTSFGALSSAQRGRLLADPDLRRRLLAYARRRVAEHEAEDVVQAALADALVIERLPEDPEDIRRLLHRITRNKIVDLHRKTRRETLQEPQDLESRAQDAPSSGKDLLSWAERELPQTEEAQSTLELMLREGDGEKLEHLAEEAALPAPRLRQRVSRLRKHFRTRWAAQVAAALFAVLLVVVGYKLLRGGPQPLPIAREELPPIERGRELRERALRDCDAQRYQQCLRGLDGAQKLDPAGETTPRVRQARAAAERALRQAPQKTTPPEPLKAPPKGEDTPAPVKPSPQAPPGPTARNAPLHNKNLAPQPPPPDPNIANAALPAQAPDPESEQSPFELNPAPQRVQKLAPRPAPQQVAPKLQPQKQTPQPLPQQMQQQRMAPAN